MNSKKNSFRGNCMRKYGMYLPSTFVIILPDITSISQSIKAVFSMNMCIVISKSIQFRYFLAAFLSCIHFNFSRTDIRAATKGKNGKTMVLPGFCKIEYNVGSSGANTTVAELFTLSTWKGI